MRIRGACQRSFVILLGMVLAVGICAASAQDRGCTPTIYNATDVGLLDGVRAIAADSQFKLSYVYRGSQDVARNLRFVSVSVDNAPVAQFTVSTVPDAVQNIWLYSLKPGRHKVYIELMTDPKFRGNAPLAIETCIKLPASQEVSKWERVP